MFRRYPRARDIRWVQEEPANMGGWSHLRHRLEAVLPEGASLRMVARKASSTPATGYYAMHVEQERVLVDRALAEAETPAIPARESPAAAARGAAR